jgi:hypothetical protein
MPIVMDHSRGRRRTPIATAIVVVTACLAAACLAAAWSVSDPQPASTRPKTTLAMEAGEQQPVSPPSAPTVNDGDLPQPSVDNVESRPFPPQCVPLGPRFESAVRTWIANPPQRRLIYNCEANKKGRLCGGMGDRFRGMISVAWTALVLNRSFQLYHPVAVPLEDYLAPNWFDWRMPERGNEADREKIPLNTQLMRLNQHGKFMRMMGNPASPEVHSDLRLQSNSFGVDPYLHRIPRFSHRITNELGLSKACNITCYFSCFYSLLFTPTAPLKNAVETTFAGNGLKVAWKDDGTFRMHGGKRFIGVQIRMGGTWATGLEVPEPFRTPPQAINHFFSILKELRSGAATPVKAHAALQDAVIFITSDSERLVNLTKSSFPQGTAFTVPGDAFRHTDSSHLGKINPSKWKAKDDATIRNSYLATLTSHFIVANADHVVMAQSGFGDTAFWHSRAEASCIFVDMNHLTVGWQHHLSYDCANCVSAEGKDCGCSAHASMNRILDLRREPQPYYGRSASENL